MSNTKEKIRTFISSHFLGGKALSSDDEALFSSGMIDSFGVLELISFLEKTASIEIDTQAHELREFDSVNLIMKLLESQNVAID